MNTLFENIKTPFQTQSQQLVINVDAARKEEVTQMFQLVLEQYMPSMLTELTGRVSTLEQAFIRNTIQTDPQFQCLNNPATHSFINTAVRAAAETSDEKDLELLGSLLAERNRREGNKRICLGIKKAIEVVPYISDEDLCAITVVNIIFSFLRYFPDLQKTLNYADEVFSKLPLDILPKDDLWIDNMQSLNAVVKSQGRFKDFNKSIVLLYKKMILVGIEKSSPAYDEAIKLLNTIHLSSDHTLLENPLCPNHVLLPVLEENLVNAQIIRKEGNRPLTEEEQALLKNIFKLYEQEENKLKQAEQTFIQEWNKRPSLKKIGEWWGTFSKKSFDLMPIGEALAYVNAKHYIQELTLD